MAWSASGSRAGYAHGFEDRDVGAGLHDQLFERQIGVAAGELAVGGEGVGAHRIGVRVVGGVVVDQLAHLVSEEVLATPRLGDVLGQLTGARHRVHVRVDAPNGDAFGRCNPLAGIQSAVSVAFSREVDRSSTRMACSGHDCAASRTSSS